MLPATEFVKIGRYRIMCFKPRFCWRRLSKQLQKLLHQHQTLEQQSQASTAPPVQVKYSEPPDKSEGDRKLYRALTLPNGLRAMLISDPSTGDPQSTSQLPRGGSRTDQVLKELRKRDSMSSGSLEHFHGKLAACAVLVDVGSFSEPKKFQGLAHFLEHMIFMGSEKYPEENAFDSFVAKSGGFSNASTENEETCFYFELEESHLDQGLDYFMNLIKAPLMRPDSMTRERSAVQSEFEQVHMQDEVRRDQVLASLASDGYPHSTFGWGNLKSLQEHVKDNELHAALHEFQQKHYRANRMVVCLQAQLSLDELEQLLVRHCADIPSSAERGLDFSKFQYDKAFREPFYKEVILVQPVEDMCKLELTWVLPSMLPHYRSKPDAFFSQLLGYEGVGSLCSYLRKRLWCMSVMAGIDGSGFESNSIYSLFNLSIYLTDEGFEHLDEVLVATFAWIRLFTSSGVLQSTYKELQQIAANNFRFQFDQSAVDNVQNVVQMVKYMPPKDVLTGAQLYFEYNEEALQLLKQHLGNFRFNIMISSHIPYEDRNYDRVEPWFGTKYTRIPMPPKWQLMWQEARQVPELAMPQPNPFVTTDFRLHWEEEGQPHIPRRPKALLKNDKCELWFRQDDTFRLPDGYINLYLITPLVRQSVRDYMLGVLYTYLVEFSIAEQLYPALEAGLTYGLFTGDKGLVLSVNGYNEKLPLLVEIILKVMRTVEIDPAQVVSFKELKKRQIFNALINAKTLNLDVRLSLLENKRFSMLDKYETLDNIGVDDIQKFKDDFHKQMYVQGLIQGNFTEQQARDVMHKVLATYSSAKVDNPSALDNSLVQLPRGTHFLRVKTLNEEDTNSIVTNYYQIGPSDLRQECLLDLIELIVEEPLFNQLRTQEQLGYSLGIHQRIGYGVLAYIIQVNAQESKHQADYVEQRIEAFRARMPELVTQLSDEEFMAVRDSLINSKKLADTGLDDEVQRNWNEIVTMEYFFNRMDMQIQTVGTLSKQSVLDFLVDYERNNLRKLSVQVVGKSSAPIRSPTQSISSAVQSRQESTLGMGRRPGTLASLLDEVQRTISEEQLLFEQIGAKIRLQYIAERDNPSHIKDIAEFKKNLHVYPLINTNPKLANKS